MKRSLRRLIATAIAVFAAQAAVSADTHKPSPAGVTPPKVVEPLTEAQKAAAKAEVKGAVKADAKGEHKADTKAEPKPAAKPAPRRISPDTRKRAIAAVAAAPVHEEPHPAHPPHWGYEGKEGPENWAKLSPEWAKCGTGERQSPIDIRDGLKVDLEQITFDYRPTAFKVVDNGHTIQVNVSGWNSLRMQGRSFKLVQFHFHRPSEEMIDGKTFEMVVHLVHQDSQGKLAVVAVLIEKGARQPVLQAVLNNLPLEKGQEVPVNGNSIDLAQMLPTDRRYFTYMGSLTTPPCTEDVLWIVMKQPAQATAEQLNLFARIYPMNARPVQEGRGRLIKESN